MEKQLKYNPMLWFFELHALLPLPVLYLFSALLYYPLYYLVRYRRKVVRKNLKASFPEKSFKEIIRLERKFYRVFCNYTVETIKLLHVSDEEILKRMVFHNVELPERLLRQNRSILLMLGHYGIWEWVPSITRHPQMKGFNYTMGQIYRPLKSSWFDHLFLQLRSRFGSISIRKQDTLRAIVGLKKSGNPFMVGFMSDQSPSPNNIHYWTPFLGQDTPVYTGVEKIAMKTDCAVLYLDVRPISRGYYEGEFKLITENPKDTQEFEITDRYIRAMEQSIRRAPEYWLWTHNRWKHQHLKSQ